MKRQRIVILFIISSFLHIFSHEKECSHVFYSGAPTHNQNIRPLAGLDLFLEQQKKERAHVSQDAFISPSYFSQVEHYCQQRLYEEVTRNSGWFNRCTIDKMRSLSVVQYQNAFHAHGAYSQHEMNCAALQLFGLYISPTFQEFLKTLPEFKSFADDQLRKHNNHQETLFSSSSPKNQQNILYFLRSYQKEEQCKVKQREYIHKLTHAQSVPRAEVEQLYHHYCYLLDTDEIPTFLQKEYESRVRALAHTLKNDHEYEKHYALSQSQKILLKRHGLPGNRYILLYGNEAQHELHQECISSFSQAIEINQRSHWYSIRNLNELSVKMIDVARDYNYEGSIDKAYKVLDFCLSIGHAALQGIGDGVVETADMILHPINTIQNTFGGLRDIGMCLSNVLYEVCEIELHNPAYASKQIHEKADDLTLLCQRAYENIRQKPSQELVRQGSKIATEWILQGKILAGITPVLRKGSAQLSQWSKKALQATKGALKEKPVAACAGTYGNIASETTQGIYSNLNKYSSQYVSNDINWTSHNYKHFPPKNLKWKEIVNFTKAGAAKYKLGLNIEELERLAWQEGIVVTNNKPWKVKMFDFIVGAKNGIETKCMRIEMSANTIHGHPITFAEYEALIK